MPLTGFHRSVQEWFQQRFGEPTEPQRAGWPQIRAGRNTLIAAPTGTGKTLAAFLSAIDGLARQSFLLPDELAVLYVSPLRALSNDVQKNLQGPLRELMQRDPDFPDIRVLVRTGDTPQRDRAAMLRKPPHILVTTPESLYILLTSAGGRRMLRTVRTVIVDEIHALARDKRGSHLALSLERLEELIGSGVAGVSRAAEGPDAAAAAGLGGRDISGGHGTAGGRDTRATSLQRIGLSATQKPLADVARFLVGVGRDCELVDVGHRRQMDVAIEVPPSPLSVVCSHEQWGEIYERVAGLIREHRTTLVFVNTRKLAERIAARLTDVLGEEQVTCHHSSLSRERRLDAEQRLKAGSLRALVATASLELGIDIGDVDLVIQIGATRSIATFLQRVGRAGHAVRRIPKGRLFPLTIDELVEAAALLRAAARGDLDRTPQPAAPLDILAQQMVAECVGAGPEGRPEDALFESARRAWPYRDLKREDFDAAVRLHSEGRRGLLHRDGVGRRLMARKRARITAVTGGGAIPDVSDFQVLQEPEGTFIGTINEDFAIEASGGDIFQLGNTSWRILKVERGVVRVANAAGQPPTIPFWLGEGPSRTAELSAEIGRLREEAGDPLLLQREIGLAPEAAMQIADYVADGRRVLGTVPTQQRVVLERFFDESGGMQMVLHAPFGGRINRAWGLALRKRFCRGFGFELQAAANEEALVISLGLQHSFPLDEVFNYLHPNTVRKVLTQAVVDQPMFESRWRWNATRSLVLERFQNGKPVPPAILRMRAGDLLAAAFPAAIACPENMPAGDLPIPLDHPLVRQTIDDCLVEATDIGGLINVLTELRAGKIEAVAVDTPEPSAFARAILSSQPYTFLDDAPLEERRTQAVQSRRALDERALDSLGALDPAAVERVRQEAWPQPESAEEVHEALLWMGFVTDDEAAPWLKWLMQLAAQQRVRREAGGRGAGGGRWFALDGPTDSKAIMRGRLEALGPVFEDDHLLLAGRRGALTGSLTGKSPVDHGDDEASPPPDDETPPLRATLHQLEREGAILRTRLDGRTAWCERRLLARIHRYTLDTLRREIEPVSASGFMQFLACWQHVDEDYRLEGPRGVADVLRQLAGYEAPAYAWETFVLPRRVRDFRREWLDELTLSGEFTWGRLWGAGGSAIRVTPLTFIPREDLETWLNLAEATAADGVSGPARELLETLAARGAMFPIELQRAANLVPAHAEMGLADLVARGLATCDSFAALRQMITPPSRRRREIKSTGRWSLLRKPLPPADAVHAALAAAQQASGRSASPTTRARHAAPGPGPSNGAPDAAAVQFMARQLLRRTGVVFRAILTREKSPISWFALSRTLRLMELRGEVRGGRFVAGFSGEQFALPEAVELMRRLRREGGRQPLSVASADPLNYQGILTPDERVAPTTRRHVRVG